ncbi:MAG TPA: hypothetical protein PKE63_14320, partial [Lacibacter sp.]|nr:hypothetical protein [Lacibacter sp.]HMP88451.1 hypothetical protein [Lacibacter sp.]
MFHIEISSLRQVVAAFQSRKLNRILQFKPLKRNINAEFNRLTIHAPPYGSAVRGFLLFRSLP